MTCYFCISAANRPSWLPLFPTEATMASIYHKLTPHDTQDDVSHRRVQRGVVNKSHLRKTPSNQQKIKGKV